MEEPKQSFGTINVGHGKTGEGDPCVVILLSADAIATGPDGEPCPGISLQPWRARMLAYKILECAEEMDARTRLGLTT
jgi:hypothetical protein